MAPYQTFGRRFASEQSFIVLAETFFIGIGLGKKRLAEDSPRSNLSSFWPKRFLSASASVKNVWPKIQRGIDYLVSLA